MRIISYILIFVIAFALSAEDLLAYGRAYNMGRLQTVSTNGPFDVMRNPAVLATQEANNVFGVGIACGTYSSYDTLSSIDTDLNMTELDPSRPIDQISTDGSIDTSFTKTLSLTGAMAYSKKITENLCAGLAVGQLVENEEMDIKIVQSIIFSGTTLPTLSPYTYTVNSTRYQKQKNYSSTTNCMPSFGYRISRHNSIGLHINMEYIYKIKEEKSTVYGEEVSTTNPDPPIVTEERTDLTKESKSKSISATIGLGYLLKTDDQEIGLLISSGKFSFIKNIYKDKSQDYDISESTPYKGDYVENTGITAGYYRRITSFLGIALEAGYNLPREYKETVFILEEGTDIYEEEEKSVNREHMYKLSGGIEINLSQHMKLGVGGTFYTFQGIEKLEKSSSDEESTMKIDIYIGTSGIDHRISENSKLTIYTEFQYFENEMKMKSTSKTENYKVEFSNDIKTTQFNLGISFAQFF